MSFAYRVSGYNRARKWKLFVSEFPPAPETQILDVGYNETEYSATDNYLEKHYPYRAGITALGIEEPVQFSRRYPEIRALSYDGGRFPFDDDDFDICWSNAVLEHVGTHADRWAAQVRFLKEIHRVARAGFVTTPNRHFPIEVHTRTPLLHWLPRPLFEAFLRRTGRGWATGDYMDLLSLSDLKRLLGEAGIDRYRIVQNRLLGFTMDFVVIFRRGS